MLFTLLLAGALQAGAGAADAADMADLRCVAILSAALNRAPEAQQSVLQAGVMFFYGRITGRTPAFDVEGRMVALLKADPEGKGFAGENVRCGKELQTHGYKLMQMGQRMKGAIAE